MDTLTPRIQSQLALQRCEYYILDLCCSLSNYKKLKKFFEKGIIRYIWTLFTASWEREMSFIVVQMLPTVVFFHGKYSNQAPVQTNDPEKQIPQLLYERDSISYDGLQHVFYRYEWFLKKLKTVSIFRKVVQSSINYSVHVVVSGLRHPHPLVSLLAPNTVFLFWKLLKTIKNPLALCFKNTWMKTNHKFFARLL